MLHLRGYSNKGLCISLLVAGALFVVPSGIKDEVTPLLGANEMISYPLDNEVLPPRVYFHPEPPKEAEMGSQEPDTDSHGGRWVWIEATAYCLKGTMANGEQVHKGAISVDPKFIPLGTKGYIDGIGNVIAEDTGGAIKGNKVDIWMPTYEEAMAWGRKKVKLWITE
jgi:3D (Asp-Asp-Asp) domain-containing protein